MVIILVLYLATVYLIFFKLKLLPFNKFTGGLAALVGVTIVTLFMTALQSLTPPSSSGMITAAITEIAPQVTGQVVEVPVAVNQTVEPNQVLFRINPRPYQDAVDQLKARLVQTESTVAQIKEALDSARANVQSTEAQLLLSRTRLTELEQLLAAGAGSRFDVENIKTEVASLEQKLLSAQAQENQQQLALDARVGNRQSQVAQVLAQLDAAQFNLENCEVRAPEKGIVTMVVLKPGMVVAPGRTVMSFIYSDTVQIAGLFHQKGLENVKVGDQAVISFPALPGRLYESTIREIPYAIGNAQVYASGQVMTIGQSRMTNLYPVFIELPEDFPREHVRLGLAANIRLYSEEAAVVGMVAVIAQLMQTSLAYVI